LDPANEKLWAMEDFGGFADDLYPTTSELFDTTGPYNQGGFSSDRLDRASAASQFSLGKGALAAELALVADQQPGLFQPVPDLVYAIKDTLSGPPASFEDASQYRYSPEYWYFKARTAAAPAA
jgi:peptide/nickel transport system substrate-binding protein